MKKLAFCIILTFSCWPSFAQSTLLWDESVNGAFGNSTQTSTPLGPLNIGTNTIIGQVEVVPKEGYWLLFHDYFRYDLYPDLLLNEIVLSTDGQRVETWIGSPDYSSEVGYKFNSKNGNLMPQLGIQSLGPGPYCMYMVNLDNQDYTAIAHYRLDFIVTSIPEPSTIMLLLSGGLGLVFLRWRKTRHVQQ